MNAAQRVLIIQLAEKAAGLGHVVTERDSPAYVSQRCTCGWSAAETRRQNALARHQKLYGKLRAHFEDVVAGRLPLSQGNLKRQGTGPGSR